MPTYPVTDLYDVDFHIGLHIWNKTIVLDSAENGNWIGAQKIHNVPIVVESIFELSILAQESKFLILIDGKLFSDFKLRKPLSSSKYLYIDEEIKILEVVKRYYAD